MPQMTHCIYGYAYSRTSVLKSKLIKILNFSEVKFKERKNKNKKRPNSKILNNLTDKNGEQLEIILNLLQKSIFNDHLII